LIPLQGEYDFATDTVAIGFAFDPFQGESNFAFDAVHS
jgi:hypothetical protein